MDFDDEFDNKQNIDPYTKLPFLSKPYINSNNRQRKPLQDITSFYILSSIRNRQNILLLGQRKPGCMIGFR